MFSNYLKLTLRLLLKNKLFTAIKLTGLTAGLTACLLIGLYLRHEVSYDACHERADRIVRTTMEYRMGGRSVNVNVTGNKVAPTFRQDFPEVESAVRVIGSEQVIRYADRLFEEKNFYFADSTLFDIFTFPLLKGDPKTALNGPNKLVLSETMAQKYFGHEDPMGRIVRLNDTKDYTISGVMADPPLTSQLKPDFLAAFANLADARPERSTWWNANYATYFLLHNPGDHVKMEAKIPEYMAKHANETGAEGDDYLGFRFEPLRDVHLRSKVAGNFEPNGDIRYIYILSVIGGLLLLIGATTYINLSTAVSTERAREVGIQKVMGAEKGLLFWRHTGEALVLSAVALVLSFGLAIGFLPLFNHLFDSKLTWTPLLEPASLLTMLGITTAIGLLSGAYPALVIARFQPVKVLKGQYKSSASGILLRKSLIVFQFGISAFLIICTMVLQGQLNFIQHKKLGYDKNQVLVLPTDRRVVEKLESFKSEFAQHNNVQSVSLAYETPVEIGGGYSISSTASDEESKPVTALPTDQDFVKTTGIELAAGTELSRADVDLARRQEAREDTVSAMPILINEAQAKAFGWNPEEAVGRMVTFNGSDAIVRGVVRNFHFASLHEPIENLVIFPSTWGNTLLVKLSGQELPNTLHFLEQKWQSLAPHHPFTYHFLDEEFDQMYGSEAKTTRLVTAFAALAIFLACLGLFALATYSIVQRTKEIGIRKVLGASVSGITGLLAKDFLKLVGVSFVLASPIAWWAMNQWLADFAYRIDIQWWMFVLAGVSATAVALLAIGFQSVRAALTNPIKSLRSE